MLLVPLGWGGGLPLIQGNHLNHYMRPHAAEYNREYETLYCRHESVCCVLKTRARTNATTHINEFLAHICTLYAPLCTQKPNGCIATSWWPCLNIVCECEGCPPPPPFRCRGFCLFRRARGQINMFVCSSTTHDAMHHRLELNKCASSLA